MNNSETSSLVAGVQVALASRPLVLPQIIDALETLLLYLSSPVGRTDANCCYVDSFFAKHEEWSDLGLPEPIHDILADMSGALHDTITSPHIAENFDSTPEQLLDRLRHYKGRE